VNEFASLEKVSHQIPGTQAHVPDTYAPTFGHVIFIIGFHYPLTSKWGRPMQLDDSYNFCEPVPLPPNNGAIHNVAEIIKGVMSSAAEAELGAMYINARKAVEEHIILEEMGHNQPATPIQVDNSPAKGIINKRVQPKCTKAMDMRFHWLRDRSTQKQFRFYWRPSPTNYANYWTKHHPAAHHHNMRPVFLTPFSQLLELRKKVHILTPKSQHKTSYGILCQ
jgi:hypothetical protein